MNSEIKCFLCIDYGEEVGVPGENTIVLLTEGDQLSENVMYAIWEGKLYNKGKQLINVNNFDAGDIVALIDKGIGLQLVKTPIINGNEITLFLTGRCNSNCIMCPYTTKWRLEAHDENTKMILAGIPLLDPYAEYVCITGGEPTLLGGGFLQVLQAVKQHFKNTVVHILTNGRTFFYDDFYTSYRQYRPFRTILGIPLYAATAENHDRITQAPGSFNQTSAALKRLIKNGEKIELRIVVSKLNIDLIEELAYYIVRNFNGVLSVSIMGLEMMGNAMMHRKDVWISFEQIMPTIEEVTDILIHGGINVELFNFPLCLVPQRHIPLYRKSISDYKIVYLDDCAKCTKQNKCGGFFRTTSIMPGINVHPYEA